MTLRANDIVVSSSPEPDRLTWSFRCPECETDVRQLCDAETARLLLMSGARAARPVTAPLRLADLASLRELMERPDFVALMSKAG